MNTVRRNFLRLCVTGFNNNVFGKPVSALASGGNGLFSLVNGDAFNGMIRVGTSDLMEDWKFSGGFRMSPEPEE